MLLQNATLSRAWLAHRPALLALLAILPLIACRNRPQLLRDGWFVPLMGIVACAIPSSGIPVAGGILFLPILHNYYGLCARDAVAFTAATQMIGVGVFAPLNAIAQSNSAQSPFVRNAVIVSILPGAAGVTSALTFARVYGRHGEHVTLLVFGAFCCALFVHVARALLHGQVQFAATEVRLVLRRTSCRGVDGVVPWIVCSFLGGLLTGNIGVGIEKVVFALLTLRPGMALGPSILTANMIVGWLSALSVAIRGATACNPTEATYVGHVPWHLWFLVLPGILVGSMIGPAMGGAIDKRNMMRLFLALLALEVVHIVRQVTQNWNHAELCLPLC